MTTPRLLIVGAGIAGITAARALAPHAPVTVLDKGRGVGGRMATRRVDGTHFDHGAQFFTARSSVFRQWVEEWETAGAAREWCRGFPAAPGAEGGDGHPRYRGSPSMNGIVKHLAAGLDVHTGTRVQAIDHAAGVWRLLAEDGRSWAAEALLLTPPAPQALDLLRPLAQWLPGDLLDGLAGLRYDKCLALMARWATAPAISDCGALQPRREPIAWIADNGVKGVAPAPGALTIHAGPRFSEAHFEDPEADITAALLAALPVPVPGAPTHTSLQRWRYAQPRSQYPERCLLATSPGLLAVAGDAFGEPRVEGAALSGAAAAEELLQRLR